MTTPRRITGNVRLSILAFAVIAAVVVGAYAPSTARAQAGWDVPNWTPTASGARVLNLGHVDISSVIVDGALHTRVRDATAEGVANAPDGRATWHEMSGVVLQVRPAAAMTVPDGRWSFIGPVGTHVWNIDQLGTDGVLWPGWSAETIAPVQLSGNLDWTLTSVRGPGHVFLWQTDAWGNAVRIFDSKNGLPDTTRVPAGTHAHANWTFTAEGLHCLSFRHSGTLASGQPVESVSHLAVVVGTADPRVVDPAACASDAAPTDPGSPPLGGGGPTTPAPAPEPGRLVPSFIVPQGAPSAPDSARRAPIATVRCPAGPRSCTVSAPARIMVTISGHRYTLAVIAPRTVRAGREGTIRVRLPAAAVRALHGRVARVSLGLRVTNGSSVAARPVRVTLTGRPTVSATASSTVDGSLRAPVATVTCPPGARLCTVTTPRRVATTIGGRRHVLAVVAPTTLRPGYRATVRVRLPSVAVPALRGRRAPVVVPVRIADRSIVAARTARAVITVASPARASGVD